MLVTYKQVGGFVGKNVDSKTFDLTEISINEEEINQLSQNNSYVNPNDPFFYEVAFTKEGDVVAKLLWSDSKFESMPEDIKKHVKEISQYVQVSNALDAYMNNPEAQKKEGEFLNKIIQNKLERKANEDATRNNGSNLDIIYGGR